MGLGTETQWAWGRSQWAWGEISIGLRTDPRWAWGQIPDGPGVRSLMGLGEAVGRDSQAAIWGRQRG